jgi:hypothetical protein
VLPSLFAGFCRHVNAFMGHCPYQLETVPSGSLENTVSCAYDRTCLQKQFQQGPGSTNMKLPGRTQQLYCIYARLGCTVSQHRGRVNASTGLIPTNACIHAAPVARVTLLNPQTTAGSLLVVLTDADRLVCFAVVVCVLKAFILPVATSGQFPLLRPCQAKPTAGLKLI